MHDPFDSRKVRQTSCAKHDTSSKHRYLLVPSPTLRRALPCERSHNTAVVGFWSKLQSNVALSGAEAELNASVKGLSKMMGICHLYQEFFGCEPACRLFTDASACKGMLLRQGSRKIKHLSTKQLWAQGAIQSYGISVEKIPRALNAADALTHSLTVKEMATHLKCLGFTRL